MYQCLTKCNSAIQALNKRKVVPAKKLLQYRYRNRDRGRLFRQLLIPIAIPITIWRLHQRTDAMNITHDSAARGPDFVHKIGRNFSYALAARFLNNTGYNGFKKNLRYLHNLHTCLILPDDIRVIMRTGILDS